MSGTVGTWKSGSGVTAGNRGGSAHAQTILEGDKAPIGIASPAPDERVIGKKRPCTDLPPAPHSLAEKGISYTRNGMESTPYHHHLGTKAGYIDERKIPEGFWPFRRQEEADERRSI